jgi:hypothetical protein
VVVDLLQGGSLRGVWLRATARHGTSRGRDPFGKVRLTHWRDRFAGEESLR